MNVQKKTNKKDPKDMRHGYTTGACATAMTKAALLTLVTNVKQEQVTIFLPAGKFATFEISETMIAHDTVSCTTIKDAGDDPDVTHLARIVSSVRFLDEPGIHLDGGVGVGRVTKPGLPVPVGEAAINPVPRKMILEVVQELVNTYHIEKGIEVVISVPDGEELAKKTLNGRLGIIGGISILGTRGIVVPFSSSAYMASIVQAISVAKEVGCDHLVLTTGGRSEKFAMKQYPDLREEAFIEMGDFAGFTLKHIKKKQISKVSLVGMMGKFSKLAQGNMMLHSKSAPVDFGFLAEIAKRAGASQEIQQQIKEANTASQVGDLMKAHNNITFFDYLCRNCSYHAISHVKGDLAVSTAFYSMNGECLGKVEHLDTIDEDDWYRG
ncbi:cobalt-precorrin-5B (C(1))-methyltransferase [Lysinibacillus yapensis]|uniref:Cobalt-precorrin-5B C(1)-methyltransferase n=1 Tax=Ureibacillus yapensis TaxID=2304605 RepID=A0A396SCW6_9BACL|nr:cobalt-precorrin-5B (C(1))-methyltransferase [Lysinibacillus yapensis]RHW39460.1 cobalt-precorrin-5B (C(1))-methyltransferase [Lysinibacillus yapensis]